MADSASTFDPNNTDPQIGRATARLMGSEVDVVTHGAAAQPVLERIADLERRWSRFLPDSELTRSGEATTPVVASPETVMLVNCAVWAWESTGGRFDPTVGESLERLGYDRDLDAVRLGPEPTASELKPALGCAEVTVDVESGLIFLPEGIRIDPGGIGKGLAADLAATEAVAAGAQSVMVSVGGDVRVAGTAPANGWELEVDHGTGPIARVNLESGALVTSSVLRRTWMTSAGLAHHVIDPRTGRPSSGPAVSVSVIAGEAWWAEAVATAMLVGFGNEDDSDLGNLLDNVGVLVTTNDGARHCLGTFGNSFFLNGAAPNEPIETIPQGVTS